MKNKRSVTESAVKRHFWHYTIYSNMVNILLQKKINTRRIYVRDEPSAVWVSSNPRWDEIYRKYGLNYSRNQLLAENHVPARIEIDSKIARLLSWKKFREKSGIPALIANKLEISGRKWGADPNEWHACNHPIHLSAFRLPCEVWNGSSWQPLGKVKIEYSEKVYEVRCSDFLNAMGSHDADLKRPTLGFARILMQIII